MRYHQFSELFLELVLRAYFDKNNDSLRTIINFDVIEPAVKDFIAYFHSYDSEHSTDHISTIKQMFITKELNRQTCDKLGFSKRTFYRHRKHYLHTFELYLSKNIEILGLFNS